MNGSWIRGDILRPRDARVPRILGVLLRSSGLASLNPDLDAAVARLSSSQLTAPAQAQMAFHRRPLKIEASQKRRSDGWGTAPEQNPTRRHRDTSGPVVVAVAVALRASV
ncbi:uncharacterized protein BP5553_04790 [Venustampulla echinocandica]|uniref:Uncharacterized protein n=1 Tax=Venustampulla echinocandica TaxID=2656787 RepID=A0A370TPA6_9HELO|nr:uncharacterized protein BP5553_04790 [Venustampulla echinocandica]RDL37357.1 hypothetical protein BP5553_04790 [Venustampulla echinocandica]